MWMKYRLKQNIWSDNGKSDHFSSFIALPIDTSYRHFTCISLAHNIVSWIITTLPSSLACLTDLIAKYLIALTPVDKSGT